MNTKGAGNVIFLIIIAVVVAAGFAYYANTKKVEEASVLKGECIGGGAYLDGTDKRFIHIREIGIESSIPNEVFKNLTQHPIVCPIADGYELVYRVPGFRDPKNGTALNLRKKDGSAYYFVEGPPLVSERVFFPSGGMEGIFWKSENGAIDIAWALKNLPEYPVELLDTVFHIVIKDGVTILSYGYLLEPDNNVLSIEKGGKSWIIRVVGESLRPNAEAIRLKGISVNGEIIKELNLNLGNLPPPVRVGNRWIDYNVIFQDVSLAKAEEKQGPDGWLKFNSDFSKASFNVKIDQFNKITDLGEIEIDLK